MPYYVYDVHTDSKFNSLCGSFTDYQGAEICERDKQKGNGFPDHSVVMLIYAETQGLALRKVKQIRRERGLP
jgi:hypothetical protein